MKTAAQNSTASDKISSSSRRAVFILVFGVVLMLWGLAAGYYELSLVQAANARFANSVITDVEMNPPSYPGLIFLGGLLLVLAAAVPAAIRSLRRFWVNRRSGQLNPE